LLPAHRRPLWPTNPPRFHSVTSKVRAIEAETGLPKSLSASVSLAGADPGRKATK
jgi:hypothetical protein